MSIAGKFKVTWSGGTVEVESGTSLSTALREGGLAFDTPCAGLGRCGRCAVRIRRSAPQGAEGEGKPLPICPEDALKLSPEQLAAGFRLACRFIVDSDLNVAIPAVPVGTAEATVPATPTAPATPSADNETISDRALGLAIDLGTTSIALSLVDLTSGEELASSARPNPQAAFGADIMSRLMYATARSRNNGTLRRLAMDAVAEGYHALLASSGAREEDVRASVLVANSAMHHLALGLSVKDLAVHPYTAATLRPREELLPGLPPLYAPPVVGSFIGSDLVAAVLATGAQSPGTNSLLIDIGTNSEVYLSCSGKAWACSAPAGPAFEGGEISQGMLALPGAVSAVSPTLGLSVIGGGQPLGICGSGILDTIVALIGVGILDRDGLIHEEGPLACRLSRELDDSLKFRLAPNLYFTQKDVRATQLAKGAVRCAIDTLLDVAGVKPSEIDATYIAGAFGSSISMESALSLGLIPEMPASRVHQVGNAAMAGAKATLLHRRFRDRAERLARLIEHIDLAATEGFQDRFLGSLSFRP